MPRKTHFSATFAHQYFAKLSTMHRALKNIPFVAPATSPVALRTAFISTVGVATPPVRVENSEIARNVVGISPEGIESRTGIRSRFYAKPNQNTSDLAVEAAENALKQSGVSATDIDLILLATATPDHLMPATACRVQEDLGAIHATALDLSAACSGFVYALWVGQQFIATGAREHVLVIGAETMSRAIDPHDRQTAMIFGDGAGAVLLGAGTSDWSIGNFWTKTIGNQYRYLLRGGGTACPTAETPTSSFLKMDGRAVFRAAVDGFTEAIQETLKVNRITLEDVSWIVPHQANARIFEEVAKRLGINRPERIWLNLSKYGNTVAASIPLALADLFRDGNVAQDKALLLTCVGAGMTIGGTVLFPSMYSK